MLTANSMDVENSSDQFELSNYIMIPTNNKSDQFDIQLVENLIVKKLQDGNLELVEKSMTEETTNDNITVINETAFLNPIDNVQLFENSLVNNDINNTDSNTPQDEEIVEVIKPQQKKLEKQYKCIKCEKRFSTIELYRKHMAWHRVTKKFMCPKCSQGFDVEDNLKVHMVYVHTHSENSCPICKTLFHRKAGLKNHVLSHQVDEPNTCDMCHSEFDTEDELYKHIEFHVISEAKFKNSLICNYCKLEFKTSVEYREHITQHLKIKKVVLKRKRKKRHNTPLPFTCNSCGKNFPKMAHLLRHERVHTGERPYECEVCNKRFNQKVTLNIHMMNHTGIKPFACTLCPAKFNQKGNLRSHMEKTHMAPKGTAEMFKCSQCVCIFKKISTLNCHVTKMHVQNPPMPEADIMENLKNLQNVQNSNQTSWEDKSQFSIVKLTERVSASKIKRFSIKYQTIDGVRYFFCNSCTYKFKKPSDLLRHIRQKHTKEKPYKCKLCGCEYSLKSALALHYKNHNRDKLVCKTCGDSFKTTRQMMAHIKRHNQPELPPKYQCVLCSSTFYTKEECLEHRHFHINEILPSYDIIQPYIKQFPYETNYYKPRKPKVTNKRTDDPHACETCGARFGKVLSLEKHMKSHLRERKYKCHLCPQGFTTKYRLKVHLNYHQDIRNYLCGFCNKRFVTSSILKRHLVVHNTHRPYMCPYCQKRFKTLKICKSHITNVHKMEPPESGTLRVELEDDKQKVDYTDANNINTIEIKVGQKDPILISVPAQQDINQMQFLNLTDLQVPTTNVFSQIEPIFINSVGDLQDPTSIIYNVETQNMVNPNEVINNSNISLEQPESDVILQTTEENNYVVSEIVDEGNFVGPWENNIDLIHESVLNELTSTAPIAELNSIPQESTFECDACHETYPTLTDFENHNCKQAEAEVVLEKVEKVEEENLEFIVPVPEDEGKRTTKVFEDEEKKLFKCVLCRCKCTSMQTYNRHIQAYHGDQRVQLRTCKFCMKQFKKTSDLHRHLRTHTGEKPFVCDTCGKKFALKSTLKGHEKIHLLPPKTVTCTVCNSQFSCKASLKVHMNIHSGLKPHKCSFCEQTFRTRASKKLHENAIHLNSKKSNRKIQKFKNTPSKAAKLLETIAEEVAKSLKEETVQKTMQNTETSETVPASESIIEIDKEKEQDENGPRNLENPNCIVISADTGILLSTVTLLDLDLGPRKREKPVENIVRDDRDMLPFNRIKRRKTRSKIRCDICQKIYSSKDVLKRHVRNVHDKKRHSCTDCKAAFETEVELEIHKKVHEDYKAYSCQYCDSGFSDELGLSIHIQRFHQKPDETPNALLNLQLDLPVEVTGSFL